MAEGDAASSPCFIVCIVVALFSFGSLNTILTKVIFTVKSISINGKEETFNKPGLATLYMFVSMALVIFAYFIKQARNRRKQRMQGAMKIDPGAVSSAEALSQPLTADGKEKKKVLLPFWRRCVYAGIPSLFDLSAILLSLFAIQWIPASVWQMLRGAEVVFAAIFTVLILGREQHIYHWLGVALSMVGIVAVSAATVLGNPSAVTSGGSDHSNLVALGIFLVIIAQVLQSLQIIVEEELLTILKMDEMLVVGLEGIWGSLAMIILVYPLMYLMPGDDHGHMEDVFDAKALVIHSDYLQFFILAFMFSCATYNVSGMLVTGALNGVMRVMLEATRTLCIWLFNLAWYYNVDKHSSFGERWTNWSYLQALGFVFLVVGQGTYSKRIKWRCIDYSLYESDDEEEAPASPASMRAGVLSPTSSRKKVELDAPDDNIDDL